MNILALDTSLARCSVALLRAGDSARALFFSEQEMTRGHAEALMPMVSQVMEEGSLPFSELDLVAATLGPGTFSGVRIAIAAARGFALATGVKLWGTDTLTVMAAGIACDPMATKGARFAIAVDARRDRLYFGCFEPDGARLLGPALLSPKEAAQQLPEGTTIIFGSGGEPLKQTAANIGRVLESSRPELQPSARYLAELALQADETLPHLRPLYLRAPDAKPQTGAMLARHK